MDTLLIQATQGFAASLSASVFDAGKIRLSIRLANATTKLFSRYNLSFTPTQRQPLAVENNKIKHILSDQFILVTGANVEAGAAFRKRSRLTAVLPTLRQLRGAGQHCGSQRE